MIDLGFTVKKEDAEKPDMMFKGAKGGVNGETHNGVVKPGVRAMLFEKAMQLFADGEYENMGMATTAVFCQFWKEWKAL